MTPSDNSFSISPHNLALSHSTLLHSYPVPLKWVCASSNTYNMCKDIFLEDIKKSTSYFLLFFLHFISFSSKYVYLVSVLDNILQFLFRNSSFIHVCVSFKKCINPIVTHFFAQSQASGTALFWAIHMYCVSVFSTPQYAHVQAIFGEGFHS